MSVELAAEVDGICAEFTVATKRRGKGGPEFVPTCIVTDSLRKARCAGGTLPPGGFSGTIACSSHDQN